MLTEQDYELLKPLQIKQLLFYLPTLYCFDIEILGQSLLLATDCSKVAEKFRKEAPGVLRIAHLVAGVFYLLVRCNGRLAHKEELGLIKTCENDRDMQAVITEEKQDFTFDSESKPAQSLYSWQSAAHHLGLNEVDMRKMCAESNVPFAWMPDGSSWGIERAAAERLIMSYYVHRAEEAIRKMKNGETVQPENGTSPTATLEPKPKSEKKKSDKPPIEFKGKFQPVKTARISAERYLEALAPEDKETQAQYLKDIVTNKAEAQRHLSKAIAAYKLSKVQTDSHTRAQLQTAFVNMWEKMKKTTEPEEQPS
jgi:hypothetical protein